MQMPARPSGDTVAEPSEKQNTQAFLWPATEKKIPPEAPAAGPATAGPVQPSQLIPRPPKPPPPLKSAAQSSDYKQPLEDDAEDHGRRIKELEKQVDQLTEMVKELFRRGRPVEPPEVVEEAENPWACLE